MQYATVSLKKIDGTEDELYCCVAGVKDYFLVLAKPFRPACLEVCQWYALRTTLAMNGIVPVDQNAVPCFSEGVDFFPQSFPEGKPLD